MESPILLPKSSSSATELTHQEDELLKNSIPSMDDLLGTLSAAADRSVLAAEAATEAERLAAVAAEEAAEAYLAASSAVGTESFTRLRDIAEAAEKNTETLTSAATAAYKDYFLAYAQSMDASAAVERAQLNVAANEKTEQEQETTTKKTAPATPKIKRSAFVVPIVSVTERLANVNVDYQATKLRSRQRILGTTTKTRSELKQQLSARTRKANKMDHLEVGGQTMRSKSSDCLIPDLW